MLSHHSYPTLFSLAQNNRTHWIRTPLTHLQSTHNHPISYLHNLISVQPPRSTRSSPLVTLARTPTSSSLRIYDRSLRYASPCLWNQLPSSLRQPHASPSVSDLPAHAPATSSYSLNSPLSPSISPSLFHSRLKTYLFHIFPTVDSLPSSGLTPRLYDSTVSSEHLGFYFQFLH